METRFMLYIVPVILHAVGIYLLYKSVPFRKRSPNQYLYILNLTVIEFIYCLVFVSTNLATGEYVLYLRMFRQSFLYTWLLLALILLTIDRFLEVYLNIKYLIYFSVKLIKLIICITPILCITISVIILVASRDDIENLFDLYVNQYFCPILNVIFLLVAVGTYGYILRKIVKFRKRDAAIASKTNLKRCIQRIYTPALLIITFFWFYLVPDFVNLGYRIHGIKESEKLQNVHYLAHWVSFVTDAVIYTLATKQVRKTIQKILNRRFPGFFQNINTSGADQQLSYFTAN